MQHLDPMRLAALDHDAPTQAELAHLNACTECRVERDAHVALSELALATRQVSAGPDAPRLTDWSALASQLRAEGLMRTTGEHVIEQEAPVVVRPLHPASSSVVDAVPTATNVSQRRTSRVSPIMRIAAALMLVIGGAVFGRVTAGTSLATSPEVATGSAATTTLAANGTFASVEEATRILTQAQRDYERASLWLASNDTTVKAPDVYRARLAALDQMMAASRAALRDAPQDPVLNHYYLAAYTAREATLQQLIGTLPVDKTIEGF